MDEIKATKLYLNFHCNS